jgi:hypothetical protein
MEQLQQGIVKRIGKGYECQKRCVTESVVIKYFYGKNRGL